MVVSVERQKPSAGLGSAARSSATGKGAGIGSKISKSEQSVAGARGAMLAAGKDVGRVVPGRGVTRPTFSSSKREAAAQKKLLHVSGGNTKRRSSTVDEKQALDEVSAFLRKRRAEVAAREGNRPSTVGGITRSQDNEDNVLTTDNETRPCETEATSEPRRSREGGRTSLRPSLRQSLPSLMSNTELEPVEGRSSVRQSLQNIVAAQGVDREAGSGASIDSDEFEAFTREVAACIIQHYWRQTMAARRQVESSSHGERGGQGAVAVPISTTDSSSHVRSIVEEPEEKARSAKHALSASLKGEDIVRLGSMVTTGGMSDLLVVVEQQQTGDAAGASPAVQKVEARSKTEKELLAWAESLVCGRAALGEETKPVHIHAIDGNGDGKEVPVERVRATDSAENACDSGGATGVEVEGSVIGEEVELIGEQWSLSEDTVAPTFPVGAVGYEAEEDDMETPTPRARPLDSIAPYGSPFRQPSTAEQPGSTTADADGQSGTKTGETTGLPASSGGGVTSTPDMLARRSVSTKQDGPLVTVRQSAQKLAEIMSFLDGIEEGEEGAEWGHHNTGSMKLAAIEECEQVVGESGVAQPSAKAANDESAALATTVFDGIKKKMAALQDQMAEAAARSEQLERQMEETQAQAQVWVEQAEARAAAQLERQQLDSKRTISRHLEFIDRLLADKDSLSAKCTSLANEVQGLESRNEAAISALKDGFVTELKRQKEAWAAAEKIKRESWAEEKTREVKELTIKGLEPEIQRLMAKHKGDMRKLEQRLGEEAQGRLDALARQHEDYTRQVRDRLLKEREDAVEKERIAAADRLRDVNERNEMQIQQLRQRLNSDADSRVEEVERLRRADRQRLEAALEKAREEASQREDAIRSAAEKQKKELVEGHERALAAAREEWDAQQEGWRAAVAERASREVAECEKRLRKELLEERNEQIEAVIDRLEEEAAAAKLAMEAEYGEREAALVDKHRSALAEVRADEERMAEKNRALVRSNEETENRLADAQHNLREMQRELKAKNGTIAWMESQVAEAKGGSEQRTRELSGLNARAEEAHRSAMAAKEREHQQLRAEMASLKDKMDGIHEKNSREMEHVEARVKAAIAKKDEQINRLRRELDASVRELRQTKSVLEAHQQAFCT